MGAGRFHCERAGNRHAFTADVGERANDRDRAGIAGREDMPAGNEDHSNAYSGRAERWGGMKYSQELIGKKVSYCGSLVIGKCEGTILSVWPRIGKEHAWALVKVGEKPQKWPYNELDTFAPDLSELALLK
jgi:hypothetical protein